MIWKYPSYWRRFCIGATFGVFERSCFGVIDDDDIQNESGQSEVFDLVERSGGTEMGIHDLEVPGLLIHVKAESLGDTRPRGWRVSHSAMEVTSSFAL